MALGDMSPKKVRGADGLEYTEKPHQVHMRYIKEQLRPHNVSWSQFAQFMNSMDYPIVGTRKTKITRTAEAMDRDPMVVQHIVENVNKGRKENGK